MKPWLLISDDVIDKNPIEGDMVMYFIQSDIEYSVADVGIIARELCDTEWIISGEIINKDNVLFVLNLEGYLKQRRFSNPLAI